MTPSSSRPAGRSPATWTVPAETTRSESEGACTSACDVTLTAKATRAVPGHAGRPRRFFDNIDRVVGSSTTADSLTGMNATATWNLGTMDRYTVDTNTLTFSSFEI